MSETITTHPVNNPEQNDPYDRDQFYREQIALFQAGKKPDRVVDIVAILLLNSRGELLIQKRSFDKSHNAGLLDKSMGGHIRYGDLPDFSVMVETVQELQAPSIVVSRENFTKACDLLGLYFGTIAVVKPLGNRTFTLEKIIGKDRVLILNNVHMYLGVYDGKIRPADQEAKGVLYYTLTELSRELEKHPETFTPDLHLFFKEYKNEMEEFLKVIQRIDGSAK